MHDTSQQDDVYGKIIFIAFNGNRRCIWNGHKIGLVKFLPNREQYVFLPGMNFADAMDGFWRNDRRETVSDSGDVQTER